MKKYIKFIPLAVAVSAGILYIWNAINYRRITDSSIALQLIMRMRMFLIIAIGAIIIYFIIRLIEELRLRRESGEPLIVRKPREEIVEKEVVRTEIKEVYVEGNKNCSNCGERIFDTDKYCKTCGSYQLNRATGRSRLFRIIFYIIQLIILIIILIFLIRFLINYKKSQVGVVSTPFDSIINND